MGGTETITVLFTDLVGSTATLSEIGEDRAEVLRREHFDLLRESLAGGSGREVKNLGDGLMAAFTSASDAVASAIDMQQRLTARNERVDGPPLLVRIGIATGEADVEGTDYFGVPVIEASRLCATAHGGQVLVTDMVRAMIGGRGGHDFEPLGARELKGLDTPVPVCEVRWAPLERFQRQVPWPSSLSNRPAEFVGRLAEQALLGDALKAVGTGSRQMVVIGGEPGVGKTTLAGAVAGSAHDRGAIVLYGRCEEDLGIPYQPWTEAIAHLVGEGSPELLAELGPDASLLSRLAPRLGGRLPESTAAEPDQYLLFGAVARALATVSREAPVVIVLDDLQWADRATLLLLRHLLSTPEELSCLFVGTFRESEVGVDGPLSEFLAASHRLPGVHRCSLTGLGTDELVAMMEARAGHQMTEEGVELARLLREETEGNPFFVGEMLRHLAETGAIGRDDDGHWVASRDLGPSGFPASVREVVGHRVGRLGKHVGRALGYSAVVGREFDLELLANAMDSEQEDILDTIEPALDAGLVAEVGPGRFSFVHAIVAHTIYDGLGSTRQAQLHRRVAEALEELLGGDPGARVGELALHWARATAPQDPGKAINYARDAGDRALDQLAPSEALRWYQQALDLSDAQPEDPVRLCALLVGLGDAQRQVGLSEHRETLLQAADQARALHADDLLVRAALANNRGWHSRTGSADFDRINVLEAAVAVTGAASAVRARLLGLLAVELTSAGDEFADRRLALSDEAVAVARALGDPAVLARVLDTAVFATWVPERLAERLAWSDEAMELAIAIGDPALEYWATARRRTTALETQDRGTFDRLRPRQIELADRLGQPALLWHVTCTEVCHAFLDGDLDRADELAAQALDLGLTSGQPDALSYYGAQLVTIRALQGRFAELEDLVRQQVEANPGIPAFRAALARLYSDAGRFDEAVALLAPDVADGFSAFPGDSMRLLNLTGCAASLAPAREAVAAEILYSLLLPWAGRFVHLDVLCRPPVAHALGTLATVLGRYDDAEKHFETACAICERAGAPLLMAMSQVEWAALLAERGQPGDLERARDLVAAGIEVATRNGAGGIERRAREVLQNWS